MGKERYWNKLGCAEKKGPNPHKVYSVSIPEHIIRRTNWEKEDLIGFQLYKGYAKSRFAIELRNLSKDQAEEQNKDFLKKITKRNKDNFSEKMQEIFIERKKNKIKKKERQIKEEIKEGGKKLENMAIKALKEEIKHKKETNKERTKQVKEGNKRRLESLKKFLKEDLQEREEMLKKLLKSPQKHPIIPKPIKNDKK